MINDHPSIFYVMTVYINIYNNYIFHLCKINFIIVKIFILKFININNRRAEFAKKKAIIACAD